ncbi:MAG: DUF4145 domain-containing protein [Sphaerochaetaceae bacterium]
MQQIPYQTPRFKTTSFNCPFCSAFSQQNWHYLYYLNSAYRTLNNAEICFCSHCKEYSIWHNETMIYPNFVGVEPASQDLDQDIQNDYQEAAEILQRSPRGAAALLRLAIQKLSIQLGEKGKDLNKDIGNLVKKGLPIKVQESLDTLRVIGNEAVHPGEMDLRDDMAVASSLFKLVNFIAEKLITEPKEVDEIYGRLPAVKIEQIENRDSEQ